MVAIIRPMDDCIKREYGTNIELPRNSKDCEASNANGENTRINRWLLLFGSCSPIAPRSLNLQATVDNRQLPRQWEVFSDKPDQITCHYSKHTLLRLLVKGRALNTTPE